MHKEVIAVAGYTFRSENCCWIFGLSCRYCSISSLNRFSLNWKHKDKDLTTCQLSRVNFWHWDDLLKKLNDLPNFRDKLKVRCEFCGLMCNRARRGSVRWGEVRCELTLVPIQASLFFNFSKLFKQFSLGIEMLGSYRYKIFSNMYACHWQQARKFLKAGFH